MFPHCFLVPFWVARILNLVELIYVQTASRLKNIRYCLKDALQIIKQFVNSRSLNYLHKTFNYHDLNSITSLQFTSLSI